MFQSSYYKNRNGKRFGPYQVLRISTGYGRLTSLQIRKGLSPMETIMLHPSRAADFFQKEEEWKNRKRASSPRPEKEHFAGQGRSPIPKAVAEIIKAAGWNRQGRRMLKSRDRFLTLSAAKVRYSLLNNNDGARIGSAENLLELSILANKLQKSSNARGRGVTFDQAFAQCLERKTGELAPVAAKP